MPKVMGTHQVQMTGGENPLFREIPFYGHRMQALEMLGGRVMEQILVDFLGSLMWINVGSSRLTFKGN